MLLNTFSNFSNPRPPFRRTLTILNVTLELGLRYVGRNSDVAELVLNKSEFSSRIKQLILLSDVNISIHSLLHWLCIYYWDGVSHYTLRSSLVVLFTILLSSSSSSLS